jgi:hypothetical protein
MTPEASVAGAARTDLKTGAVLYCNMRRSGTERTVTELLEPQAFEARRDLRLRKQRESLTKSGLLGTVVDVDAERMQSGVLVRRSEAWYARWLRTGETIVLARRTGERLPCGVIEVRPDYSRARLQLRLPEEAAALLSPGESLAVFMKVPDRIDFDRPPDFGRFTGRQERIDYMVSTIYCPCGMMGDSCAGHWNTLAACKLHGCGMPNLVSKLVGEWIDAGKSDADILAALVQRYGKGLLKPHLN